MNTFAQVEAELAAAMGYPSPGYSEESESGMGTARALTSLIDQLSRLGGASLTPEQQQHTFALALRQVDASGRPTSQALNKPDISYLATGNDAPRRINIEIETRNLRQHVPMVNRDRGAHNVFLLADPWTGAIKGGLERLPGSSKMRRLNAVQAQGLVSGLPTPLRDPTLSVNPKTGRQVRRLSARRPARRAARESEFSGFPPPVRPVNGNGATA